MRLWQESLVPVGVLLWKQGNPRNEVFLLQESLKATPLLSAKSPTHRAPILHRGTPVPIRFSLGHGQSLPEVALHAAT